MGLFISLEQATRDMRQEAAAAGFYHSDLWAREFARIQLRTVGEMLSGQGFDLPPRPGTTSRRSGSGVRRGGRARWRKLALRTSPPSERHPSWPV